MSLNLEYEYIIYNPSDKYALIYELGSKASICALLSMKNIIYQLKEAHNSRYMSNNGQLPVVYHESSPEPLSGFQQFHSQLIKDKTILELSYIDWIQTKFLELEMYYCWCDEGNDYGTFEHFTNGLSWPTNHVLFHQERRKVTATYGSKFNNMTEVLNSFDSFLFDLNDRIVGPYCLSKDKPSAVDALIYGYSSTSMNDKSLPWSQLFIKYDRLRNLVSRIDQLKLKDKSV